MKRRLVSSNDEILQQKCQEVPYNDKVIAQDVLDSFDSRNMVGLSAPQIGLPYRCSVCYFREGKEVVINPTIEVVEGSTTVISLERCLSFPNILCKVPRQNKIKLTYFDNQWNKCEKILEGLDAYIAQHECDHLDGVTMIKKAISKQFKRV